VRATARSKSCGRWRRGARYDEQSSRNTRRKIGWIAGVDWRGCPVGRRSHGRQALRLSFLTRRCCRHPRRGHCSLSRKSSRLRELLRNMASETNRARGVVTRSRRKALQTERHLASPFPISDGQLLPSSDSDELGVGLSGADCNAAGSTGATAVAIAVTARLTIPGRLFGAAFRFAAFGAALTARFFPGLAVFLAGLRAARLAGLRAAALARLRAAFLTEVLRDFLAAFFVDFLVAFLAIEFLHSFLPHCRRAMRRLQPFIAH